MDPNANLQEQEALLIELAMRHDELSAVRNRSWRQVRARRLAELREALTSWLRAGGFAPDWSKAPAAARRYGYFGVTA